MGSTELAEWQPGLRRVGAGGIEPRVCHHPGAARAHTPRMGIQSILHQVCFPLLVEFYVFDTVGTIINSTAQLDLVLCLTAIAGVKICLS